jgi:glycosyltransferase involved in cell wall biosynthesis
VKTFRAIQQVAPKARYVWVGDGPARAALQAAHPDFIFAGVKRDETLAAHYASADLFPFPSLSETFGNVILEALAAGLPVVAYAEGAAREHLIDGNNGFCITSGDAISFTKAAVTLAGDIDLIRLMGQTATASVERLSPEAVIREFENLLRELVEENMHDRHVTIAPA